MPSMEIKDRFKGLVLYSCEALSIKECLEFAVKDNAYLRGAYLSDAYLSDANLSDANLRGANLSGAYLRGAYLSDAYLSGANLRGAYLSDAYLSGANLRGAKIREGIEISKIPIQVSTTDYFVSIYDTHMQIGCEFHAIADWFTYENRRIIEMDGKRALEFWWKWKEPLQAICKAEGRS